MYVVKVKPRPHKVTNGFSAKSFSPCPQALSFLLLGSFTVALLVLVAATLPISDPLILGGDHLIWILWLVAPLLATSFLASPADGSLMKRTPEKNDPKARQICAYQASAILETLYQIVRRPAKFCRLTD